MRNVPMPPAERTVPAKTGRDHFAPATPFQGLPGHGATPGLSCGTANGTSSLGPAVQQRPPVHRKKDAWGMGSREIASLCAAIILGAAACEPAPVLDRDDPILDGGDAVTIERRSVRTRDGGRPEPTDDSGRSSGRETLSSRSVQTPDAGPCGLSDTATRCVDETTSQRCNADGHWDKALTCSGATPVCRADLDGACGCVETQRRCVDGAPEVCTEGAWRGQSPCEAPLVYCLPRTGQCVSCEPESETCQDGRALRCDEDGQWQDLDSCAGRQVHCGQCAPGEPCVRDRDCADGICLPSTDRCGCGAESCQAPLVCSGSTGMCEPPGSDCPPRAPVVSGEADMAIVSVRFLADDSAEVEMSNVGAGFISFQARGYQLCNGMDNCVFLSDDVPIALPQGDSATVTIPNTVASGGELAIVLDIASDDPSSEAYVAWGTGQPRGSLEMLANKTVPFWALGQRITISAGDTGFVCTGDTDKASGYTSCNP